MSWNSRTFRRMSKCPNISGYLHVFPRMFRRMFKIISNVRNFTMRWWFSWWWWCLFTISQKNGSASQIKTNTWFKKKMWLDFFYFIVIHYIERTKIGILLSITSVQLLAFHFPFWHVHHPKLSVNISVESERSQWQQHKILVTWLTWKRSRSTGPPSTRTLPRCKRLYQRIANFWILTWVFLWE